MANGVAQLPDDPILLKQIITQRDSVIGQHIASIAQRDSALALCDLRLEQVQREAAAAIALRAAELAARDDAIAARSAEIELRDRQIEQIKREAAEQMEALRLKHQAEIHALLRRFYGPHNERFDPAQLLLFGKMIDTAPLDTAAIEQEAAQKLATRRPRHKHGRQNLPEHLERIVIEHDLPAGKKPCPCCGKPRPCIGTEVTEQLEFFPACFKVLRHVQYRYGCIECDKNGDNPQIELAPKPPQPIEKGLAGPGLLAYVIVSKLADHLPLYRLENIFARQEVHVAGSTMCGWIMSAATLLAPLVLLMKQRIKQSKVIHSDETRLPVQHKIQCRNGRIWVYIGDMDNPYLVFQFTPDRTNEWPIAWLKGFEGHLQADAYAGYDALYRLGKVIEVACWAHARRKFFDAKETDGRRSAEMLERVRQLYAVEDEADKKIALLTDATQQRKQDIRRDLRQRKSVPVLNQIKTWLDTEIKLVLPRSPMAEAINYTLNQWQALCVYAQQGFLNIDNNAAERALKLIAIGRKNWLFAGNDTFGEHYATLYSLIASAQRHGLNPQAYLTSVLSQIATTPMSQLEQFLPDVWKSRLKSEAATPGP
jgi:transposase